MKIIIKELKMKGFKNHKEEIKYIFKPFTTITGDNGQGKTTIADAIAWCLATANYSGKEKVTKELLNQYSKVIEVNIILELINDNNTEIKEFKRIAGGGKDVDGFFINGEKVPSHKFINDIGVDKNLLFSMINPFYFSSLSKSDAKDTILEVVKKVEDTEVVDYLESYQKELLIKYGFKDDINKFFQDVKESLSQLKKDEIYFQGAIDAKSIPIELPTAYTKEDNERNNNITLSITKLDSDMKKLYTKEYKNQKLLDENLENINKLKQKLAGVLAQNKDSEIKRLLKEIEYYKSYPLPQMPQMQNKNIIQQQIVELRNKYATLATELKKVQNIKILCTNCSHENILENPKRKLIKQQLTDITTSGRNANKSLELIEQQNRELQNKYQQEFNKVKQNINNEVIEREKQINRLKNQEDTEDAIKIKKEILCLESHRQKLQEDLLKEKEERSLEINNIQNKINSLLKEKEALDKNRVNYNNLLNLDNQRKLDLEKYKKDLEKTSQDKINYSNLSDVCKNFITLKVKLQQKIFNKYLSNVEISLEKVVKSTGELKEDFSISYKGKEFAQISASEKIKAGLELINMFAKLKQIYLPIIIDNAESITQYDLVEPCQTIELRVKKDVDLSVA